MKCYKTPTNWKTKYYCHNSMATSNDLKKNIDNFFHVTYFSLTCGTNQCHKKDTVPSSASLR